MIGFKISKSSSVQSCLVLKHTAKGIVDYLINFRGGGVHKMLRIRVCAAHMDGFLGQNSLNKGPFFGRFSINIWVGYPEIGEK